MLEALSDAWVPMDENKDLQRHCQHCCVQHQLWNRLSAQVYPTSVRSLGTGLANSMARLGSILSPFVAVVLVHLQTRCCASVSGS